MPLPTEQLADTEAERAQLHAARRVVSERIESCHFAAHPVPDRGFVRVINHMGLGGATRARLGRNLSGAVCCHKMGEVLPVIDARGFLKRGRLGRLGCT